MKNKAIISSFIILASASAVHAQKPVNPMTQAMLDAYETLLRENPADWLTLYERASQYYMLDRYDEALDDINRSIAATPAKEKEQLASAHTLAANIHIQRKDYNRALAEIDGALSLAPNDYTILYNKGNICLYLDNTADARKCFQAMQRLNPRSQEALFGLAKAAVMEGETGEARSYMEQAERLDPSNFITYCRLGDLYADMDENQNAAANYLSAFSLNSRDNRALTSLFRLAEKDYAAVAEALDFAMGKTSNVVPLLFIKGNIAKENDRISDAYAAYGKLVQTPGGATPEVFATMAGICRANNSVTEALGYAQRALAISTTPRNMLLKASICYDLGDYEEAVMLTRKALEKEPQNIEAMLLQAESWLALQNTAKATEMLDEAIMNNPLDFRPLLLRGYLKDQAGDVSGAAADWQRAGRLEASAPLEIVYKAVGQQLSGKGLDADNTIKSVADKADRDAESAYLMALYHASTGSIQKGVEMLARSRRLGFDNRYLLDTYAVPMLSVLPVRNIPAEK